jgi:hypothetical protein
VITARASSGPIVGVGETTDEGAVDLQYVDREAVQVGERGVAGAEVIDRQSHAEGLDAMETLEVGSGVIHGGALGQLDHPVVRLEPGFEQRLRDILYQLAVLQVTAGDVDRQAQPGAACHRGAPGARARQLGPRRIVVVADCGGSWARGCGCHRVPKGQI